MHALYCHIITEHPIYYVLGLAIATIESGTLETLCNQLGLDFNLCGQEVRNHVEVLELHKLVKISKQPNSGNIHIQLCPIPPADRQTLYGILQKNACASKQRV